MKVRRCTDFDKDCDEVTDKIKCYLYDPVRGYCPYLREPDRTLLASNAFYRFTVFDWKPGQKASDTSQDRSADR